MLTPRIERLGDDAWLVSFEPRVDVATSDHVLQLAAWIRRQDWNGVRDVVPAVASLAIHVARDADDGDAIEQRLNAHVQAAGSPDPVAGALVEIPVVYGGAHGPDLPAVAQAARLGVADVVRIHTAATYRVFMLGFLPGFPYLGPVDPAIHVPRLAVPRTRVPAGSIGLAGAHTGIYPRESPGGWQIIGRTAEWLFDVTRTPPARLAPGDQVRFVAVESEER